MVGYIKNYVRRFWQVSTKRGWAVLQKQARTQLHKGQGKTDTDNIVSYLTQHSEDHRGTPEKPGRVVTLIPYDEWKTMEDVVSLEPFIVFTFPSI